MNAPIGTIGSPEFGEWLDDCRRKADALEVNRRIELLDDEPGRAFSRLSALIDPALHAELKARAAFWKLTMGELIEPTLRGIAEPRDADKSPSARGLCLACLFSCALLFGVGYLLGRM